MERNASPAIPVDESKGSGAVLTDGDLGKWWACLGRDTLADRQLQDPFQVEPVTTPLWITRMPIAMDTMGLWGLSCLDWWH